MKGWTPARGVVSDRAAATLRRHGDAVPVRAVRVFWAIDGRDRILMLAGQAFIAVIPLLIVVATVAGVGGGTSVGAYLVRRFDLEGSAERFVRILFDRPPEATGGVSLVSVVVLLWSANSFARSIQRTFAAAWGLPGSVRLGAAYRMAGLVVLLGVLFGVSWLIVVSATIVASAIAGRVLAAPATAVCGLVHDR